MQTKALISLLIAVLGGSASAAVGVLDPWVRTTTSFQKSTVAFMQLTSSDDARLVRADSPVAASVELHQMVMKNYAMKMQSVPGIDLPAGKPVALSPDSYMVMLTGLRQQIREGDVIPISIVVEGRDKKRETFSFSAVAKNMDRDAGKAGHQHTHGHSDGVVQTAERTN